MQTVKVVYLELNELYAVTGQVGFVATQRVDGSLFFLKPLKVLQQKRNGGILPGYNTKNYTEQGGDKTVIGGTLEIKKEPQ